jgi:hypothetical protein
VALEGLTGAFHHLKKGQSVFRSKTDIIVRLWKVRRLLRMINTIRDVTRVNTGRKDRRTNLEIKKPYSVVQYNKFKKGIDEQTSTSVTAQL